MDSSNFMLGSLTGIIYIYLCVSKLLTNCIRDISHNVGKAIFLVHNTGFCLCMPLLSLSSKIQPVCSQTFDSKAYQKSPSPCKQYLFGSCTHEVLQGALNHTVLEAIQAQGTTECISCPVC